MKSTAGGRGGSLQLWGWLPEPKPEETPEGNQMEGANGGHRISSLVERTRYSYLPMLGRDGLAGQLRRLTGNSRYRGH